MNLNSLHNVKPRATTAGHNTTNCRVPSAKVVAKPAGSQSQLFVTKQKDKETVKCIEKQNGKELKGATISDELAKKGSALISQSSKTTDLNGDKKTDKSSSQDAKKSNKRKSSSSSSSSMNLKGSSSDKSSSQKELEQQVKDSMKRIQETIEQEIRELLAEQERIFCQKESEMKERECHHRKELEQVLRQGDAKEREFCERERCMREEFQQQLRDQEMEAKHERQMWEQNLQAQKEEQFHEQERKLQELKQQYLKLNKEKDILAARAAKAEQEKLERERQLHDIQQRERRERELLAEQERLFFEKQELEERVHQQQQEFKRREMEWVEAEWEHARQQVPSSSRERDRHDHKSSKSGDRGTKRPYHDDALYDEAKRPIRHDIRESMGSFHQSGMPQESRSIRRESPPRGYERGRGQDPVGYPLHRGDVPNSHPDFQGNQMGGGGGYKSHTPEDRGRRVSSSTSARYQSGYGRRY